MALLSPENRVYNKGDTRPVQTLVGSSLSVWYSGSDQGYGTNFPIYECVCVEFDVPSLTVPNLRYSNSNCNLMLCYCNLISSNI